MQGHNSETYDFSWQDQMGLARIINVSGTMTALGASISVPEVRDATAAAMGHFLRIHDMQAKASEIIVELTGAEAGCVTASASAGITLAVAGCITGMNPAHAEALPKTPGARSEVVIQLGHMCGYGAPISQAIELTGATVRPVGQSTLCMDHQIDAALGEQTAAAVYVVSHHVVHYGQCPLRRFAEICHAKGVPVIVDAASEYDLRRFLADGADVVIYSGHKFLGGPTSGVIAGQRELVRAAYLQNMGIGRGFKIGKESIMGTIAALEAWKRRDHVAIRAIERAALALWVEALSGIEGVNPRIIADPTGNPLERLQVEIDAAALGASAATLARVLGQEDPAIIVRNHEVELGYFQLDPCNLQPGQARLVAASLRATALRAKTLPVATDDLGATRNGGAKAYLDWLDNG